jgi:outer membrane protein assembly factor BamB
MIRWFLAIGLLQLAAAGDWMEFRGPGGSGIAVGESVPQQLAADKNVAWRADLIGRGLSSPIVIGSRVIVTASSGARQGRLSVLAFDVSTGRQLWSRTFWATGPTDSHPKNSMAAPTPVSDGKLVVALFATNDLVCLDLDGNVQWLRSLYEENPGATDGRGLASSPVIAGSTVVVLVESQNTSFAAGIDLHTGSDRWHAIRPRQPNWTTPLVLPANGSGEPLVLVQGTTRLSAYAAGTGREVWALERGSHPIASSCVSGMHLYVPGDKGLEAFELQPGSAPPKLLWEKVKLNPSTASPLVKGDRVYCLRGPILVVGDARTGEMINQVRLKGEFSSSPVAAGNFLYCFSEDGLAQVVRLADSQPKVVSSGAFSETILCTPAIADGALYVRSDRHLWKIQTRKVSFNTSQSLPTSRPGASR